MDKLVLIDGHSILNRAFYGVPDLTNAEGLHTNAVYGFLNIMLKILEEEKADHLAVAFDLPEPTFRHKMFDAYKGTRKPMPEELREQVPLIKEALTAMEIPAMRPTIFWEPWQSGARRRALRYRLFRETGISYSWQTAILRSVFPKPAGERQRSMIIIRKM